MIASVSAPPKKARSVEATVVWMHEKPLRRGATYLLKHTSQTVPAQVVELRSRIQVEHLTQNPAEKLALNDIGEVVIETSRPLLADLYRESRFTGSFILIDQADNTTAGAGMIRRIADDADSGRIGHATRGLLDLGNRVHLVAQIEQSLLESGAVVLRTRVPVSPTLINIARLGAVVLVESASNGPITLTRADIADAKPHELAPEFEFAEAGQIINEIQRLGTLPTGDENDNGLGI
jgi:sulfate adenylyltransferase subunit 1 (EFTu-like GTPase family)